MIKLIIDRIRLHELLISHFDDFQVNKYKALIDFCGIVGFVLTIIFAPLEPILKYVLSLISLLILAYILKKVYCFIKKEGYTLANLENDIHDLDETLHHFSIVAVRSLPFGMNHFLLYHDTRWDCDFFPNIKTQPTETKNENSIKAYLKSELNIRPEDVELKKVAQKIQLKYSYSHKQRRYYDHILYIAQINELPDIMKHNRFQTPDGKEFRWATIHNMENDPVIQKRNSEVVSFVKENIY